jgi:hypothetical protein
MEAVYILSIPKKEKPLATPTKTAPDKEKLFNFRMGMAMFNEILSETAALTAATGVRHTATDTLKVAWRAYMEQQKKKLRKG